MEASTLIVVQTIAQVIYTLLTMAIVLYAAKELRESGKARRTSQYQAAVDMMFNWRSDIIANPELANRMKDPVRGTSYFREVIDSYGAKTYFHTVKLFHIFEYLYLLKKEKVIPDEMWVGWERNLGLILTGTDAVDIWIRLKGIGIFEQDFTSTVDALLGEISAKRVAAATGAAATVARS